MGEGIWVDSFTFRRPVPTEHRIHHQHTTMKTILLLLLLLPLLLEAQTIEAPMMMNLDGGTTEQVGPVIAVGPDGTIYVGWVDLRSGSQGVIYLRRSENGGDSFSGETILYDEGSVPAGRFRSVAMKVGPDGTLHVAWVETIGSGDTDIRYLRSTDRGTTFSEPVSVVADTLGAVQDFPSIAIDSVGTLYIAWIDGRELKGGSSDYDQIWMTRSDDGGQTFGTPRRASYAPDGVGGSCECCPTAAATTPDGDLLIAYRSNVENVRDVFVARTTDRGESFRTAVPIASEPWNLFACPVAGPGLAVDRFGTAHITWKDGRESAPGQYMYYTILPDDATVVPQDEPLSTTLLRTNSPTVVVGPDGGIFTTFDSFRSGRARTNYLLSTDGGNTFDTAASLDPERSGTNRQLPELAIGPDGVRYLVWQDDASGNSDILFARDTGPVRLVVPAAVAPVSPIEGTTIDPSIRLVWSAPQNLAATDRVIYDVEIENVVTRNLYPAAVAGITLHGVATLPNGEYRWRVRARTATGASEWSEYATFTMGGSSSVVREERAGTALMIGPNPVATGERLDVSVTFATRSSDPVTITLLASDGRSVAELFNGPATDKAVSLAFDLQNLPAGVYWVVVKRGEMRIGRGVVVAR